MYSEKKSILQLIALLKAHQIEHCVLCPGSRNAPIMLSLSQDNDFHCYSITDERSAGFFAMGIALNTAQTVAVICTSGSALLNLYPSVAEAYYQHIPLLIISADRPQMWLGQQEGQTIPQANALEPLVKHSVNLPEVHNADDEWYCNRLINEAILSTQHHQRGPAHINIPISEPLFKLNVEELPQVRKIERFIGLKRHLPEVQTLLEKLKRTQKRMVLVGQHNFIYLFDKQYRKRLAKQFVWLGEHISNQTIPAKAITNFDLVLRSASDEQKEELRPELLITYGGHNISKELKQYLRSYPPQEHWHIDLEGKVCDLFCALTSVIELDPFEFLETIANVLDNNTPQYPKRWEHLSNICQSPNFTYSSISAVQSLLEHMPKDSSLHLANSSAIRYAQLFTIDPSIEVCSNRGVNGIEGSLSTAVGYALTSKKLNFIIIGDLSFFYDINALWHKYLSPNIRILLLNNGGGEIFANLKGLEQTKEMKQFVSGSHKTTAKALVEDRGLQYMSATCEQDLIKALDFLLTADSNYPRLVEVFTDEAENIKQLQAYYTKLNQK